MATWSRFLLSGRHRISILANLYKSNINLNHNPIGSLMRNVSTTKFLFDETPIKMPALSPTMESGIIVKWHKKEGDKISAGDVLCEVQTDKAVVAFEFDDDGVLAKILVPENSSEIAVGDLIAIVCGEDDDWQNVKIPENLETASSGAKTVDSAQPTEPPQAVKEEAVRVDWSKMKISPSARNMMDQYGLELSAMRPSGPKGILMKEDVVKVIEEKGLKPKDLSSPQTVDAKQADSGGKTIATRAAAAPPPPDTPYVDIEITSMRKTIAKRLTESKASIPHAYMSIKCFMDGLVELRRHFKQQSLPVSINDMIVKAAAIALKQVPHMNCQWNPQTETVQIIQNIDVSIAVATPTGLITPIIKMANRLTLEEISAESKALIQKAKDSKLRPEEFVGGTFSISNLGMFDVDHFVGVINPPQAAILAVGSTRSKFFGEPDSYRLRTQAIFSLSYDARAIDEEVAAEFMEHLRNNLENPDVLLHSDGSSLRRLSSLI